MALTAAQQTEFDKVKEKVDYLLETMQESLSLQAYGGYHILNEVRDLKAKLPNVENA